MVTWGWSLHAIGKDCNQVDNRIRNPIGKPSRNDSVVARNGKNNWRANRTRTTAASNRTPSCRVLSCLPPPKAWNAAGEFWNIASYIKKLYPEQAIGINASSNLEPRLRCGIDDWIHELKGWITSFIADISQFSIIATSRKILQIPCKFRQNLMLACSWMFNEILTSVFNTHF